MNLRRFSLFSCLFLLSSLGLAAASFDDGESLFRDDRPADAIPVLEKAVLEPGVDERAWLYLGLSYQELGKLDEAAAAFRKGAVQSQRYKALFYYDLANIFVLQNKNSFAIDMFGQAIALNDSLSGAYLNRANAKMQVKDYPGAKDDYKRYLDLEPQSSQKSAIESLIAKLDAGIAEAQQEAEAQKAKAEAEAQAKKDFQDKMAASLKAAADETTSLSAGASNVQGYGDELKIDE